MPDIKLEAEWIATAPKMIQLMDRINGKIDKQDARLQKLANSSKKASAEAATGFNKLEKEFKENVAALKKLERGTDAYAAQKRKVDAMRKVYKKTKDEINGVAAATKKADNSLKSAGVVMGTAAAAATALFVALNKVSQAQKDVASGGADTAVTIDTLARRLQVQAELTDPQRKQQTKNAIEVSSEAGATAEVGLRAARQLASSGFKGDTTTNGMLETILEGMNATNFDGSPEAFVQGLSQTLEGFKVDKTNENLRSLIVQTQGVFKENDFQITELGDFAKNASLFKGAGLDMKQSFAGFAELRKTLPASESSRGLKALIIKMQKGDVTKESAANLERLWVTPGQVDFVGENLIDVLSTLRVSLEKMAPEDRNQALIKAFGDENISASKSLIGGVEGIKRLEDVQGNVAQFEKDAAVNAAGMQADRNREENQRFLDQVPVAGGLHAIDIKRRRRDNLDLQQEERAAVEGGGIEVLAIQARNAIVNAAVDAADSAERLKPANTTPSFDVSPTGIAGKLFDILREQVRTGSAGRSLEPDLPGKAKPPIKVVAPAMRQKEVPLPAAAAP